MAAKIKKGDEVIVIAGKANDRKKVAKVLEVFPKTGKALVEGVNLVTKHQKPNPQLNVEGGRIQKEAPVYLSKLMVYNAESGKGERVGFKFEEVTNTEGKVALKKVRYLKQSNKVLD